MRPRLRGRGHSRRTSHWRNSLSNRKCERLENLDRREGRSNARIHFPRPLLSTCSSGGRDCLTTSPLARGRPVSHNDHPRGRLISAPEDFDTFLQRPRVGTEIHYENLVLLLVDRLAKPTAKLDEFLLAQLAEKDAVLRMIAEPVQRLEDLRPSLVVRDIVRDKIMPSGHGSTYRTVIPW